DAVVDEPVGGAHRDATGAGERLRDWIVGQLDELVGTDPETLVNERYERFRRLGEYQETAAAEVEGSSAEASGT
ncbi:MAG: acetyl-CoA carboxylase carboxyl transferase subunit alpha, partial [Planctomycetota bacterium]